LRVTDGWQLNSVKTQFRPTPPAPPIPFRCGRNSISVCHKRIGQTKEKIEQKGSKGNKGDQDADFQGRLFNRFRLACVTFDGLRWNTKVKKEKIEQKEAKEAKETGGCGFSARLYDQFPFVRATFYELGI
jgi:hypothetical protein